MKTLFTIVILIFFAFIGPAWSGKGPYPDHAAQMCNAATEIMVNKNECESANDCNVKDRLKWSGDSDHIYITVFEAGTLKSDTVHDLISLCFRKHDEFKQKFEIKLIFYRETIQKRNHDNFLFWGPVKPFMELKLRKGDIQ